MHIRMYPMLNLLKMRDFNVSYLLGPQKQQNTEQKNKIDNLSYTFIIQQGRNYLIKNSEWTKDEQASSSKYTSTVKHTKFFSTMSQLFIELILDLLPLWLHIANLHRNLAKSQNQKTNRKTQQFQQHQRPMADKFLIIFFYCFIGILLSIKLPLVKKTYIQHQFQFIQLIRLNTKKYNIFMMMKSQLDLQKAVQKVFGSKAEQISSPTSYWKMFKPFKISTKEDSSSLFLKLIEVPSNYRISEGIIEKAKSKHKGIIHNVNFIEVERNFYNTLYLVEAQQNLYSVESYVRIKREAGQKIDENIIEKFLQFASLLQSHELSHQISFKMDQIGMDDQNNFYLCNYLIYFASQIPKEVSTLAKDIKIMLCKLLMPFEDNFDLSLLYSYVQQNYSQNIRNLTEKIIGNTEFKASQLTTVETNDGQQNLMETTLTDSFHTHTQNLVQEINSFSAEGNDLTDTLLNTSTNSKGKGKNFKNRSYVLFLIFVVLLIGAGAVTFKFLKPRPLLCLQSEYLDKELNQCLGCDQSCGSCLDRDNAACLSCNGNQFLIKKSNADKTGKCNNQCSGIKIKSNVCIDNQHTEKKHQQQQQINNQNS